MVRSHRFSFPYAITVSAGVSHYQGSEGDAHAAIRLADEALCKAKQQGRDRTVQSTSAH
ncbi:diguanylate cyclase domain-containing protein [Stenotrophomonas maltophilia]|uniref:diguanylate cyclase domain-containing protein n=1 Tax=Stenotrophomonas maltophilia TaxID=40324 RepID=UPI0012DB2B68